MDMMIQSYMEETEEMLQKAEECIIRLEKEYSSVDVNELFRIAHTIKGSSMMVGYEDIGNLMHKIEDMLDYVRNDNMLFDQSIVSLSFEGLDTVKKMLEYKNEQCSQEVMSSLDDTASRISEMVESFIMVNKKEKEKTVDLQSGTGIVSSLLNKQTKGKNKYYITFFIEEDAPMLSPVLMIILKSVEDIGTLVYSSISDSFFECSDLDNQIKTFDIIICTDIDKTELYTYFQLFYVEGINIVDLNRNMLEKNDHYFNDNDNTSYIIILKAFTKLYNLFFNQPKEFIINKEELRIIESLNLDVVNAFNKLKNKNSISTFIKDFNELYSLIFKIYEGQLDTDEKLCQHVQVKMVKLIEIAYNYIKGKRIFSIFKAEKDGFIHRLRNFIEMVNKSSIVIILIDLSKLDMLKENEVKDLIQMKKKLEDQGIEIGIILNGDGARRTINIFDSIKPVEEFKMFGSELDAILEILHSEDSFPRIIRRIKSMQ